MSPLPWAVTPNGATPEVDGYILLDANDEQVGLIEKKENALAIIAALNAQVWRQADGPR